jgi:MFS family permease
VWAAISEFGAVHERAARGFVLDTQLVGDARIVTVAGGSILGRCFQGLAQGTFFVCSVATVLTLFPAKYRGIAFSIFAVTSLSGAASGSLSAAGSSITRTGVTRLFYTRCSRRTQASSPRC